MTKYTQSEIERREAELTAELDAKNLADLERRQSAIVEKIKALIEVGHTPELIMRAILRDNQQMWVEAQFAKSVARAIIAVDEG